MTAEPLTFVNSAEWDAWLAAHHDSAAGATLDVRKKNSSAAGITVTEAGDVALGYGWIDRVRRARLRKLVDALRADLSFSSDRNNR